MGYIKIDTVITHSNGTHAVTGDGVLSPREFRKAPWFLRGTKAEERIQLPTVLQEIEEDLVSMNGSMKDLYSRSLQEKVEDYIEEEVEEEEKVRKEIDRRRYHVFGGRDIDLW